MRIYEQQGSHLFCGHWNGSPVEIGVTPHLTEAPRGDAPHHHDYHEYYVVLEGDAELDVAGETVPLRAGSVVMVEPGEVHHVARIGPAGVRWVIIKERSIPNSKHLA